MTYDELVAVATLGSGDEPPRSPYRYQTEIAERGLPELLAVPTGCGKTLGVVLGWLFRRLFHPNTEVRNSTPRRLVYVLPQRVLVEQVAGEVRRWLDNLGLTGPVGCEVLMGGESRRASTWRLRPERETILVGTQDMLLSRALNRGYGDGRYVWPVDFGLLHSDCAWVFDEVQLMGPALPTSRQLEGLRRKVGSALPCTSTWMSATIDEEALRTIDLPSIGSQIAVHPEDRTGPLATRLGALRQVEELAVKPGDLRTLARSVREAHVPGTRTIVALNTVQRAQDLYREITRLTDVPVVLVHSRFRPPDRQEALRKALKDPDALGCIVVTTQVLEAGVDITSRVLVTEAAPPSSIVQRAGRCNRDGEHNETSRLLWLVPKGAAPYADADVAAGIELLRAFEGQRVTTERLAVDRPVEIPAVHPVLRRRDLVELFDTLPDLTGTDIDIARFIRDADDRELAVAWDDLPAGAPAAEHPLPARDERCPVPIAEARQWIKELNDGKGPGSIFRYDHLRGSWIRARARDLVPGQVLLAERAAGGYDPERGWSRSIKSEVPPLTVTVEPPPAEVGEDLAVEDDPASVGRKRWLGLVDHLADVEAEVKALDKVLAPGGLTAGQRRAALLAGMLHDIGKAHPVFVETLAGTVANDDEQKAADAAGRPWAKSAGTRRSRHARRGFRHELVSALALLDAGGAVIAEEEERDLIVYLVAAHHGRVRLGLRSLPDEQLMEPRQVLGVQHGEEIGPVEIPGGVLPASRMDLTLMELGGGGDRPSWGRRMTALRDREDLGPFRLAFLEAVVRVADWRASARADGQEVAG